MNLKNNLISFYQKKLLLGLFIPGCFIQTVFAQSHLIEKKEDQSEFFPQFTVSSIPLAHLKVEYRAVPTVFGDWASQSSNYASLIYKNSILVGLFDKFSVGTNPLWFLFDNQIYDKAKNDSFSYNYCFNLSLYNSEIYSIGIFYSQMYMKTKSIFYEDDIKHKKSEEITNIQELSDIALTMDTNILDEVNIIGNLKTTIMSGVSQFSPYYPEISKRISYSMEVMHWINLRRQISIGYDRKFNANYFAEKIGQIEAEKSTLSEEEFKKQVHNTAENSFENYANLSVGFKSDFWFFKYWGLGLSSGINRRSYSASVNISFK